MLKRSRNVRDNDDVVVASPFYKSLYFTNERVYIAMWFGCRKLWKYSAVSCSFWNQLERAFLQFFELFYVQLRSKFEQLFVFYHIVALFFLVSNEWWVAFTIVSSLHNALTQIYPKQLSATGRIHVITFCSI